MYLYSQKNGILHPVHETGFKLERDMQRLAEANLDELFSLEFVASEFQLNNLRIDTLGFDNETSSFVIIEYKRGSSYSVIDQGFSYLSLLLNNKADFVLAYNEKLWKALRKDNIDWSSSRVVFVADAFTRYQQEAINFKDLPIELWEMKRFSNEMVTLNQFLTPKGAESIKTISKTEKSGIDMSSFKDEVRTYDEEYHLDRGADLSIELYQKLKGFILDLNPAIQIEPKKMYVAFKSWKKNVASVWIQKSWLKVWLHQKFGTLQDPFWICRDMSNVWNYGSAEYEISIQSEDQLYKAYELIRQAVELSK